MYEKKLENFCNPRMNEVMESHRFWQTKMEDYPSFDNFLTELRKRADNCNFTDKDRQLKDKIVFSSTVLLCVGDDLVVVRGDPGTDVVLPMLLPMMTMIHSMYRLV